MNKVNVVKVPTVVIGFTEPLLPDPYDKAKIVLTRMITRCQEIHTHLVNGDDNHIGNIRDELMVTEDEFSAAIKSIVREHDEMIKDVQDAKTR